MKSVQRLGIVAALAFGAGSCWAQPKEPTLKAPGQRAATQAELDAARETLAEAEVTIAEGEESLAKGEAEVEKAEVDLQKTVRDGREERWRDARQRLREALNEAGFGDKALQDAIIEFVTQQDVAREAVRSGAARCAAAVEDQDVEDDQLQKLLLSFQSTAAKAQAGREAALAALDAQVHFSDRPRLKTLLTLQGILGSEAMLTSDALSDGMDELERMTLYPEKPTEGAQN